MITINRLTVANWISRQESKTKFMLNSRTYFNSSMDVSPEISKALQKKNKGIVALESTIITHGMPLPHNLNTAMEVEDIIRYEGAVPATIAIMCGRIKVGLTNPELVQLAGMKSAIKTVKTSRRDMAYVVSQKLNGGTTVAGTLIIAKMAGIQVFATGGIGGVHRDGENTMDISADLIELGKSPVAVVSSGIKSILDIPKTMEFLETQGVVVSSYQSQNNEMPAFYTRTSGVKCPYNFNTPTEAAEMINTAFDLNLKSGILIAVPVPQVFAMDEEKINLAITNALAEAKQSRITGKEITPFILSAVSDITAGKSLETNMALIKNNAKVAAQIAVEMNRLRNQKSFSFDESYRKSTVVIGGCILDTCYTVMDNKIELNGATYKSKLRLSAGGVGRNIAEGIAKFANDVQLISVVGNDQNGNFIKNLLPESLRKTVLTSGVHSTANCSVILDSNGDCKLIVGDMDIHNAITPEHILNNEPVLKHASLIVMDANVSIPSMNTILKISQKYKIPVFFEPTDMQIANKPFTTDYFRTIKFISPNIYELRCIAKVLNYPGKISDNSLEENVGKEKEILILQEVVDLSNFVNEIVENVIVTLGSLGVVITNRNGGNTYFDKNGKYHINTEQKESTSRFYRARLIKDVVNVSGAGDSFVSGFITAMLKGQSEDICVSVGLEAAYKSLQTDATVPEHYFDESHDCWRISASYENINNH